MMFTDEMDFRVVREVGRYSLDILVDNVTGVEYIFIECPSGVCITPRLNPDGSLRVRKEEVDE